MWSTILTSVNSGDTTASPAKFYYGVKQKKPASCEAGRPGKAETIGLNF